MTDTSFPPPSQENSPPNPKADDGSLEEIERKGRLYDRIALLSFIVVEAAYAVIAGYAIEQLLVDWDEETQLTGKLADFGKNTDMNMNTDDIKLEPVTGKTKTVFVISTFGAFGVNALMVLAMRMPSIAGFFVWLGPVLFIISMLAQAAIFASQGSVLGACIDFGIALIFCGVLYLMRDRFQLAKYTIVSAAKIVKHNASILLVTFALMMIQLVLAVLNIAATVGVFLRFQPAHKECSEGVCCSATVTVVGCVFTVWAQIWLASTLSNLVVVTLAGGPFSSHYFCPKSSTGYLEKDGQPTGRVGSWEAFGKAFKYSMGATAFGSFLIGLIHLIHDIVSSLISSAGEWAVCLCYLCNMFMGALDKLAQKFNKYVYIYVAIGEQHSKRSQSERKERPGQYIPAFRMTFWEAASHTVHFIVRRPPKKDLYVDGDREKPTDAFMRFVRCHGIAVLINDDLSQSALSLACIASGAISAAIALACVYMVGDAINDHWYDWAVVVYAFILGLCLGMVFSSAMGVGVSTLFVCMSEDITKLHFLNEGFSDWLKNHGSYSQMFIWLEKKAKGQEIEDPRSYHDRKHDEKSAAAIEEGK